MSISDHRREQIREAVRRWRERNPKKVRLQARKYVKGWRKKYPLEAKYKDMKMNAKRREILFRLTFNEWLILWKGYVDKRGVYSGQYVLARYQDKGNYEIGNVYLTTVNQNCSDGGKIGAQRRWGRKSTLASTQTKV